MKKIFTLIISILLLAANLTVAFAIDFTPVQDNAGALSQETIDMIYNANEQVYDAARGQIFVATDRYLPDGWQYADEYANQLFNDTGIGDANKNNGILLYFTTQDNKIWMVQGAGIKNFNAENLLEKYFYNDYDNYEYDKAVQKLIPQLVKVYGISYKNSYGNTNNAGGNNSTITSPQGNNGNGAIAGFWIFIIIVLLIIFIVIALSRRTRYIQSPYYMRTGPRPSWFWFMPGFYMGSRYNRPHYYNYRRNPPPPPGTGGYRGGYNQPLGSHNNWGSSGNASHNGGGFFSGGMGGRSSGGGSGRSGRSSGSSGFNSGGGRSSGFGGGGRSGGSFGGGGGHSSGGGGGRR